MLSVFCAGAARQGNTEAHNRVYTYILPCTWSRLLLERQSWIVSQQLMADPQAVSLPLPLRS